MPSRDARAGVTASNTDVPTPPAGAVLIDSPLDSRVHEFYDEDHRTMFRAQKRGYLYRLPSGEMWGYWRWERR